ncbi:alcohol dehydrogenase catalytic domain-containing protein [Chlorobium sp. BLA1]|uniref:alcohol dehydrogenase catalytic domain-containing protein n=1 Tax=Candidatus Chlorobium masyuteum TaxID=2716876 RepID=UPI0014202A47|nr:alcohol dehydrogenase catalytic domain-containing protein [Candidatus Chlorobium masyuteum]NHQ60508.1 alcohol dehydrogenase catalytic domain-containing protein [Candidatus Chlorobium masyuteum]NTU43913.1 alcohol dehydrogenase catalytic domain-containing protein [Chlorobiaceae bacterium]
MQGEVQAIVLQKANKMKLQNAPYLADQPGDVLIKTIASTITPGYDRLLLTNKPVTSRVFTYPIMPGSESIGQVINTGPGVSDLKPGDFVYAFKGDRWRGIEPYAGCHAEMIPTSRSNVFALGRQPIHRDLLIGVLGYVISAIEKVELAHSSRILLLGLGSVGLMVSEYLNFLGFHHFDAVETFSIRGQLSHAENIALDISDFTTEFNNRYDLIIETTGRVLLIEKAMRLLKQQGKILLMGNYEVMAYDYRLICHKEPVIISSGITTFNQISSAAAVLEGGRIEAEKFFTDVFPVSQFELAYRRALDSKESVKTVLSWV